MPLYFTNHIGPCSVCNGNLTFISSKTNINVCPVCNTVNERLEGIDNTKNLALHAIKHSNDQPIQIGTKGKLEGSTFEVIGRLQLDFATSTEHRFFIKTSTDTIIELIVKDGFYAIIQPITADFPSKLATIKNFKVGTETTELLKGVQSFVVNKNVGKKLHVEGEVSYVHTKDVEDVYELSDTNFTRLMVRAIANKQHSLFKITYHSFEYFLFEPTILVKVQHQGKEIGCDKCGRKITLIVPTQSVNCVCPNCCGWNEIENPHKLAFKNKQFTPFTPDIPIGTKGILNDKAYTVVGACVKNESGSIDTYWREYTLYNTITGFAFLAEYNGHFTFLKEVKLNAPWPAYKNELAVEGDVYDLFNDYSYLVKSAVGEFDTTLSNGSILVREYIAPPTMYSAEFNSNNELVWFKGEFIANTDVYEGLQLVNNSMPEVFGVGPLQTQSFRVDQSFMSMLTMIIVVLFFGTQIALDVFSKKEMVYQNTFVLPDSLLSKGINTASFELTQSSSNLQFTIESPVNNSWFEAAITLVNDRNGVEYAFEKGVEYYYGYTEGESWSEGDRQADVILSSIPSGKYHLNIFPSFGVQSTEQTFAVSVVNDVPMWRNFFILVFVLLIYPLMVWWRSTNFEKDRWNNSPHNPYKVEES
jgi:hypothetical protein